MPLLDSLNQIQLEARKNKEADKLSLMQVVLSAIKVVQIDKGRDLTDAEIVDVLKRQTRQLEDALVDFEKAQRQDLIQKTKSEIELLSTFLPAHMNGEELERIVEQVIEQVQPAGPQDFGKVMKSVMQQVAGRADGKVVQQTVQRLLQK